MKKFSEERRIAASERMKRMHAEGRIGKKKVAKENTPVDENATPAVSETTTDSVSYTNVVTQNTETTTQPVTTETVTQQPINQPAPQGDIDIAAVLRRLEELEQREFVTRSLEPATFAPMGYGGYMAFGGKGIGTQTKYSVNPKDYPNPCARLMEEERLQRFGFKQNYELSFEIKPTSYETIDKVRVQEPRFTLKLIRIVFDEETGLPTNKRFVAAQMLFHEDPEAAIVIATDYGIYIDEVNEKAFLDEMRYLRMRDWLFECFYPPKQTDTGKTKEVVIGNKVVQMYEVNGENSKTIPFNELTKKL